MDLIGTDDANQVRPPVDSFQAKVTMAGRRVAALADDESWLATIREEYAKIGVDVDREAVKARAWLTGPKGRGRKFTRAYLLNWLSRADRTVSGTDGGANGAAPVDWRGDMSTVPRVEDCYKARVGKGVND